MENDKFLRKHLLLEKAFKRYETGFRSVQRGAQILQERGEVELRYARGLREWAERTGKTVDEPEFDPCDEITVMFKDAVREAEIRSKMHQDIFFALRDNESPLEKITSINQSKSEEKDRKIDPKKLTIDFKKAKSKRKSLEDCENEWSRVRDRYVRELKALTETKAPHDMWEGKSQHRLDEEIAALQVKINNAKKMYASSCKKHRDFKETLVKDFDRMYSDLEVVERDRLTSTVEAFKRYQKILGTAERMEWRMPLSNHVAAMKQHATAVKADKVISHWLQENQEAVTAALTNPTKSLMSILFDNCPALKRKRESFGSDAGPRAFTRDEPLRFCESLATRPECSRSRPRSRQGAPPQSGPTTDRSVIGALYSSSSSSESLLQGFGPSSSTPTPPPRAKFKHSPCPPPRANRVRVVNVAPAQEELGSTSSSELDIPEIPTLPSTVCDSPPPSPTEFCASSSDDGPLVLSKAAANVELTNKILSPTEGTCKGNDEIDASMFVNARVQANRSFDPGEAAMLKFKKGQLIKQKVGKNEKGYSYGWTRSGRFALKRYGFYPSDFVSPYQQCLNIR